MIACSRMYNLTPAIREAWDRVFVHAAEVSGVPLDIVAHAAPAPLDDLWTRNDMGAVFMCGWPFATAEPRPVPICAPVPAAPHYGGEAVYFTCLAVRRDSGFATVEDTFGGRIAWTAENSHSGFNALRHHLLRFRTPERPILYRESVGPLVTPAAAIGSVMEGKADLAPVDSFVWDLLARHAPERIAGLRIVDRTAPAPFPPIVASPGIAADAAERLGAAFTVMAAEPGIRPVLDFLLLKGFAAVNSAAYDITRRRAEEAAGPSGTAVRFGGRRASSLT